MDEIRYSFNDGRGQYEAHLGDRRVGVINYRERDNLTLITHTGTETDMRGRGIAGELTRFAMDDLRAKGRKVKPICPYTVSWMYNHPEYRDLKG